MTDKELLEAAGKAAGIPRRIIGAAPGYYALYPDRDGVKEFVCMNQWNPLTDDGDALRLAAKLEMLVDFMNLRVIAGQGAPEVCIDFRAGEHRRAIVRAAAFMKKNGEN